MRLATLRHSVLSAKELRGGSPLFICSHDNTEYLFPRFWGVIVYDWGQLLSFVLWVVGNFLWARSHRGRAHGFALQTECE